jgi:hypothetical protein
MMQITRGENTLRYGNERKITRRKRRKRRKRR